MKLILKLLCVSVLLTKALWGQVAPNASIYTDGTPFDGGGVVAPDTVTLVLDGSADAGVLRTENTMWLPDGSPMVLGDLGLGAHAFVPQAGPGTYWLQFRLVDVNENYQDQWISFTVQSGYLVPNASVAASGAGYTLTQDGQSSAGVAWTENVIWRPDGNADVLPHLSLGTYSYTPSAGSGTYWYQYRIVDNNSNFRDQWISFTVP